MTNINNLFFELLRVAIGTEGALSRVPSPQEWKALYDMAKKQSLVGICFAGLQRLGADADSGFSKLGLTEMQYLTWMGMAAKIQQRNEVVNRQCVELQKRLAKDGFRSYIMKGQAVATLYRLHDNDTLHYDKLCHLRQSGDIDVYLDGGLEKVLSYARTFGKVEHVNELEMTVPVFSDTEVEFHYRPFIMRNPFKNKRLQAFFDSKKEDCFANRILLKEGGEKLEISAPTMEFNLVHQLAHIHLHLFTEGIGMRQLMDYYMVLRTVQEVSDVQEVQNVIHALCLDRFASALMWVLGYVLGMDRDTMFWEPNEKDGSFLLGEIMKGGNFGRHNENQNQRKGKVGYSLWAVFFRNLRLSRFDRGDWFWGPLWRVSHKLMNKTI